MTRLYQCMQFSLDLFMQYGRVERRSGILCPELNARYLVPVFRRESFAAEACAIEAGCFYDSDPAVQYDLRRLMLLCKAGGHAGEKGGQRSVPGPNHERYEKDQVLELMFCNGVRIIGLHQLLTGAILQEDEVIYQSFLRSASMSRNGDLSFVAQDICEQVLARCSLGLLQQGLERYVWAKGVNLSKFDAYLGLALSDATPIRQLVPGDPSAKAKDCDWTLNEETVVVVSDTVFCKEQKEKLQLESRRNKNRSISLCRWPHGCYWDPDVKTGILNDEWTKATYEAEKYEERTPFDGEGILSPDAAKIIRRGLGIRADDRAVSSFQIRMPMCKGMLHEVDFHRWVESGDCGFAPEQLQCDYEGQKSIYIRDMFGQWRDLRKVKILLTASMFKCHKWVEDSAVAAGMSDRMKWYFDQLRGMQLADMMSGSRRFPATLWVCKYNKNAKQQGEITQTNYQILHTAGFDLETCLSLAEASVKRYVDLARRDEEGDAARYVRYAQLTPESDEDDADAGEQRPQIRSCSTDTGDTCLQRSMAYMPELLYSVRAQYAMKNWSVSYLQETQTGRLELKGYTRFLSADLMTFLWALGINAALTAQDGCGNIAPVIKYARRSTDWELDTEEFDAPCVEGTPLQLGEGHAPACAALFRNPHMSREEHMLALDFTDVHSPEGLALRRSYLGHLEGTVMLSARSMGAARLSGADFDGDIVRVITEPLYVQQLYHSLTRSEQELGLTAATRGQLPCLPLVNIKQILGTTCKLEEHWLREKDRQRLHKEQFLLWNQARRNMVGSYSDLAVHYGAIAYGFPSAEETDAQREQRQKAAMAVRRLTALVGYEIDSTKTGFTPKLPKGMAISYWMRQPFLKYKKDAKESDKADIWRYYPSELKQTLSEKAITAREGARRIVAASTQAKMQTCWLNTMPWYMNRAGYMQAKELNAGKKQKLGFTAAQLRQKLGLASPVRDARAQRRFLMAVALCKAQASVVGKKEEKDSNTKEQIARILFMQQPQRAIERDYQEAEGLIETLKNWFRQATEAQPEERERIKEIAGEFCTWTAQPEFLFSKGERRAALLTQKLEQLHNLLESDEDAEQEIQFFVQICICTDHEGYRLPLLTAVCIREWIKDSHGLNKEEAYRGAEKAVQKLGELCTAELNDKTFHALTEAFANRLLCCSSGGERLQRLRELQTVVLGEHDPQQTDVLLADLALCCADTTAMTAQQLQDAGLSEDVAEEVLKCVRTESNKHRFLWDFAGPSLYNLIWKSREGVACREPDFARLRAELSLTGGEQA